MATESEDASAPPRPIPGLEERFRAFGHSVVQSFSNLRTLYRWALIGITVGVISGFVAIAFYYALEAASSGLLGGLLGIELPLNGAPPGPGLAWSTDPMRFWLLPLMLVAGGLAVGLLTTYVAPETAGHGTDEAIRAFHQGRGVVRTRTPPVKFLVSVLTLGTGGSGGREGPTAQIGAGLGSLVAGPLGLSTRERRVALMTGVGAGIGAIFKAPFGAALLSSEILYIADFEPDVIMPSILASVISYSIFGSVEGFGPEFATPAGLGWTPEQLPLYALLGAVAALAGIFYVVAFRRSRQFFSRLRAPLWVRPAVGVGILGAGLALAYYLLQNQYGALLAIGGIGIGYGVVQWLIYQTTFTTVLLVVVVALVVVKITATALTVGSGGSGGLFGPGIVTGAFLGFAVAGIMGSTTGLVNGTDVAAFSIIGMMAFFGSVSKAPIAVILMVVEMTGSEAILVPAMVAIFIAYYLTGPYHLYEEQVPNRLASPTHAAEYFSEFLRHVRVRELLQPDCPRTTPDATVASVAETLRRTNLPVVAVVDVVELVGEVRVADIRTVPLAAQATTRVREVLRENPPPIHPDVNVLEALTVMDQERTDAVLVYSEGRPRLLDGVLTRERIGQFQRGNLTQV